MANQYANAIDFKIDNASASLTAIECYVNSASIQTVNEILDDTGLCDTTRSKIEGLASVTIPLNGWVNSTTEGIFGPLVGTRTSISKTWGYYNGIQWYTGEGYPENVTFSGNVGELQTWSCNIVSDGAITRTSVAPT